MNKNNNHTNEASTTERSSLHSQNNSSSSVSNGRTNRQKRDTLVGGIVVVAAQLACASTASCIHSLPVETPSVLRGLWRQTLTSLIFLPLAAIVYLRAAAAATSNDKNDNDPQLNKRRRSSLFNETFDDEDQKVPLLTDKHFDEEIASAATATQESSSSSFGSKATFIVMAMAGAALLNDTMVLALQYASSAAVMCLINTTPIWLILYSIVTWTNPPGWITIVGAAVSIVGAVICAGGGGGDSDGSSSSSSGSKEQFGCIIATFGALGGAMYMKACRNLSPMGIHPVILTLMINLGMMVVSTILCLATIEGGISFLSMDIAKGFFGFLNHQANPAAFFQSVFPDCFGNFGIMIALGYFEPLIVSMIMLTEPLNASLIAMAVVHEDAPSHRTIIGVSIVLVGCAIVLWESSRDGKKASVLEEELQEEGAMMMATSPSASERREFQHRVSITQHRRESRSMVLLSTIGTYAPDITAKAGWRELRATKRVMRKSLLPHMFRQIGMESWQKASSTILEEEEKAILSVRRATLPPNFLSQYGSISDEEE